MGILVLVIGEPTSGKSTSINRMGNNIFACSTCGRRLQVEYVNTRSYEWMLRFFHTLRYNSFAIDDSQSLFQDKPPRITFTDFVNKLKTEFTDDKIFYFMHHPILNTTKAMLMCGQEIEQYFDIVIYCDKEHKFNILKSPKGMFGVNIIDNNLKLIDDAVRNKKGR